MTVRHLRTTVVLAIALGCCAAAQASTKTGFFFTSSPSSWVGGGNTAFYQPSQGYQFSINSNWDNGVSLSVTDFANPSADWWYLDFAAADGAALTVGTYTGAQRFPFESPGHPGLSFYGDGRGDNTSTGAFKVLELTYHNGQVASFAADFFQFDEGNRAAWNFGEIRYHSNVPFVPAPVPEPTTGALLLAGAAALVASRRAVRRS